MRQEPEIYFHVGLGKVGSTYLQKRFFPLLKGIKYIPTSSYKKHSKRIIEAGKHASYLVSREFDRQFEREVRWFTKTFPQAKIIIFFRKQDSWIASQYKRYVKNGWYHDFNQFLDLENDTGMWKKKDLYYLPMLQVIEECCTQKPLILFYDDMVNDLDGTLNRILNYTGAHLDVGRVSKRRVHQSFSEKQLKVLRRFCSVYIGKIPRSRSNMLAHWLFYRSWWAFYHLVMYMAAFFPAKWVPKQPLIDKSYLNQIGDYYLEDWNGVIDYAKKNNPV